MGYTNNFFGGFKFSRPLQKKETKDLLDIISFPPTNDTPGEWCPFEIGYGDDCMFAGHDVVSTLYVEWVKYLIGNFFGPAGVILNGEVEWQGEERYDLGKIVITDNIVKILKGKITYHDTTNDTSF